ncbi:MAG: hypothetical protein ACE148_08155 [Vicinamibacterales bacterium]
MTEAEQIWRKKSDEDLIEAAGELEEYTEEGQRIILAEIERRGLEIPGAEPLDAEVEAGLDEETGEPLECLRCDVELRYLGTTTLEEPGAGALGALAGLLEHGRIDIFTCPQCGKIELFAGSPAADEEQREPEREAG